MEPRAGSTLPRPAPAAFAEAVLDVTGMIPPGKVLTYGDVAELLACGGPRQVGRALSHGARDVPWWRVLRAGGRPARGLAQRARSHYEDEGTPVSVSPGPAGSPGSPGPAGSPGSPVSSDEDYRVDLTTARWRPSDAEQAVLAGLVAPPGHEVP